MSINSPELVSQLAEQIANRLLNQLSGGLSSLPASRSQNWRFKPPQRSPETEAKLKAYWGEVFTPKQWDTEWFTARDITPITASIEETTNGHQSSPAA